MKTTKRIIAAVLMVMMLASVMVLPASAADQVVLTAWSQLPTLRYENYYSAYHVAMQRFLQAWGGNCEELLKDEKGGDGIDGYFGSRSVSALEEYQRIRHLDDDGHAGPQTRRQMALDMSELDHNGLMELKLNNELIYYLLDDFDVPVEAIYILRDESQELFYRWK